MQIIDTELIKNSNAWPFVEAYKLLKKINFITPKKGYVLFETGYGPSGLPHIGTFAEVARTVMIMKAFEKISDIPTKLVCFSDDMDPLRKVPSDIPNQELIHQYMNQPLTSIPDPFGIEKSYGDYMNKKLLSFLNHFGFEYEFISSTNYYKSGKFDNMLSIVLEKYDQIMDVMLPTLREERRKTYSPIMPICPKKGVILQVPIQYIDKTKRTVFYIDEKNNTVEIPITGGNCKLQWKVDFAMRWVALGIDYEMYGKDHLPNAKIYSKICRILGGHEPIQFFYELFLDEHGQKISKSKGNSISIDQWLKYAPLESILLFIYKSPTVAKKLSLDTIPQNVDEYLILNNRFFLENDLLKKISNPVYHIHYGLVPEIKNYNITYSLLLNLSVASNPYNENMLWNFIKKYKSLDKDSCEYICLLINYALNYYNDIVKPQLEYIIPQTHKQIQILHKILDYLNTITNGTQEELIQNKIYNIGTEIYGNNLYEYFKDLYKLLLGKNDGPRMGSFIKLLGIENTQKLIKEKLEKISS